MGTTAAGAAGGQDGGESPADGGGLPPWEQAALDALCWDWGEAYEVAPWKARRRDGLGGWIEAAGPGGLRAAIVADYSLKKVPRR
jgi:hypothetical protein